MSSNAIPPSVTPPSPNEWLDTRRNITAISNAAQAQITSPSHGFTSLDEGMTTVDFLQVGGMIQINGLPGLIQKVIDTNNFTVNINTSNFFTYTSGGIANILTGIPPVQQSGFQIFNTPWQNVA